MFVVAEVLMNALEDSIFWDIQRLAGKLGWWCSGWFEESMFGVHPSWQGCQASDSSLRGGRRQVIEGGMNFLSWDGLWAAFVRHDHAGIVQLA
jgi:hypothetical protein